MCVAITMMPGARLTLDEIAKMASANGDGFGLGWARRGLVQWYKTIKYNVEYFEKIINYWVKYPRVVHFRLATVGGTRPDLCHPFEIGPLATCNPIGESSKIMIHNGHFSRWSELHDVLKKENLLPDDGPWSDTRLAALLANNRIEWLEVIGGKVATLDGEGQLVHYGDWKELREGIKTSNSHWDTTISYKKGGYNGYRQWKGWEWSEEEFDNFIQEKKMKEIQAKEEADKRARGETDGTKESTPTKTETQSCEVSPREGTVGVRMESERGQAGHGQGVGRYTSENTDFAEHVITKVIKAGVYGDERAQQEEQSREGDIGSWTGRKGKEGVHEGQDRDRAIGTKVTNKYDPTPWENPVTHRVYAAEGEDGRVVDITSRYRKEGR